MYFVYVNAMESKVFVPADSNGSGKMAVVLSGGRRVVLAKTSCLVHSTFPHSPFLRPSVASRESSHLRLEIRRGRVESMQVVPDIVRGVRRLPVPRPVSPGGRAPRNFPESSPHE